MELKVGDTVFMSLVGRQEYRPTVDNPHHLIGVVIEVLQWELAEAKRDPDSHYPYRVRWSNGRENVYRILDLNPATIPDKKLEDYL